MAEKRIVTYVSDLSGVEGDVETLTFGVDGQNYEIDLTPKEAETFRKAFEKYASVARKQTSKGKTFKTIKVPSDATAIRAWAQANGVAVSERGRISQEVRDAYEAAEK